MNSDTDGVYTKTQAYNFLKGLLGLSKKDFINKKFFSLFFRESDNLYLIRQPEDIIKMIFSKEGIAELNKMYYQKKMEHDPSAEQVAQKIMFIVRTSLVA